MKNPGCILVGFGLAILALVGAATCVPCPKAANAAPSSDGGSDAVQPLLSASDVQTGDEPTCALDAGWDGGADAQADATADAALVPVKHPAPAPCPASCAGPVTVIVRCAPSD